MQRVLFKCCEMKNLLTLLLLLCCGFLFAQCPDFTNLNGSNVICQYGSFNDPFQYTGIVSGRHTVITQQGGDPYTGYQLPFLPLGESRVVKLGNEQVGSEAEAISYDFTVDPDSAILLLKFAVVFEDPNHDVYAQPRFIVRVLNSTGELVESCAEYDVTAANNIPGFNTFIKLRYHGVFNTVRWRPWTNVGIDLSNYVGQSIRLQFVTYDCAYTAHFGYAYFTASCISNKLALNDCNGSQVTLVAPSGFESYTWDNGSTNVTATYTVNGTTTANCHITSATGCSFTLSSTLSPQSEQPTTNMTIYDTICEGDAYNQYFFNLPAQNEIGTYTFRNTFFNTTNCSGGDITTTLFLTILQKYYHIYDAVCQGTDYSNHGFYYTNLQTGQLIDTLIISRMGGCDSVVVLHLSVSPSFTMENELVGESIICDNGGYTYFLPNASGMANYYWNVPDGTNIISGQGTSCISFYVTDQMPNNAVVTLYGENGCGSGSASISIEKHSTYYTYLKDTICAGNEYHQNGFDLFRQDSAGISTFINRYSTVLDCDSVVVLQLFVASDPKISTLAEPAEICFDEDATIYAVGQNAGYIVNRTPPPVAIGDIYCTDGSIVKPSDWPCNKTAYGIVFYVDTTGEHGWVVHLEDQGFYEFGGYQTNINTITGHLFVWEVYKDFNGLSNTQKIRARGNQYTFPAAWSVDLENGWYLPAA